MDSTGEFENLIPGTAVSYKLESCPITAGPLIPSHYSKSRPREYRPVILLDEYARDECIGMARADPFEGTLVRR